MKRELATITTPAMPLWRLKAIITLFEEIEVMNSGEIEVAIQMTLSVNENGEAQPPDAAPATEARAAELEAALAEERAANEWPPVKEAPPESGVYIGWVEGAPFTIAASYDADYDDEDSWPWSDCETGEFVPVTHWRHLPLPPQEPTP